jgi:signal transduction histidine kinase
MLKIPKENRDSSDHLGVINILERQGFGKEIPHAEFGKLYNEMLTMMSMASHDIRGIAVSVAAALKLIRKGFYGRVDETAYCEIDKLLKKMAGLEGILEDSLSRCLCLNGELEQLREKLDLLEDILLPVLRELSQEINERGVIVYNTLRTSPEAQRKILGNRFLLKAVVRNLLKNAMKYSGKDPRIAVGSRNTKDHIKVNIYNSGKPVPKEYRDQLFRKFGRISPSYKSTEGIGLGLYLVKKIIQKHGGTIHYEAKKKGSNFIFTLPTN